jgi:DNA-binding NtrC family response regulator
VIDEVLHLPLATQHKLLGAMESRTFAQMSSSVTHKLTARLLFTTEHDLNAAVDDGEFLASFASQLSVHRILLPPLREHREDIRSLALAFLATVSEGRELEITQRALQALEQYDWPGNMRELRQVMQRACLHARGATVDIDDFSGALAPVAAIGQDDSRAAELAAATRHWLGTQSGSGATTDESGGGYLYDECMRIVETALIAELLRELDGNRAAVAARLGLHRTTLRQKMKRYKLD